MKNMPLRLLALLCLLALRAPAQELDFSNGCNFHSDKTSGRYTMLGTTEEAEHIVDELLKLSGIMTRPFTLQATNVENAQANERKGVRYLLYSNNFIQDFKKEGKTKWAAYFVFAHEIGHHVLGHNFGETTPAIRRKMERQADEFAAVALARLKAPREDALAAVRNLRARRDEKPEYYPDISVREEAIGIAFDKEWKEVLKRESGSLHTDQIPLALDPASFNRWNLIQSAAAFLSDEKVRVTFKIPQQYQGRMVQVMLCSNNPNVRVNTLLGAGTIVAKAGDKTVEWNYLLDNVARVLASQPQLLRIYVYDVQQMPKAKISPNAKKISLILGGAGIALGGVGLVSLKAALKKHDNYKQHLGKFDAFYTDQGTDRDAYYTKADRQYVGAQAMLYAGGGMVLGSAIWVISEKAKARKALKNTSCAYAPHWQVVPTLLAQDTPGIGFSLRF